jgi:RecJ-like exonuclease
MREINDIPFETDDDIRHTARVSMEHDITSHGGSINNGVTLNAKEILEKYQENALEKSVAFEAFLMNLLS